MRISSINLVESKDGLAPFSIPSLGNVVVLSGSNGSGKTRLLKLLGQYVNEMQKGREEKYLRIQICMSEGEEKTFDIENASEVEVVNYSHYDAQLQLPKGFPPYVISKAKEVLQDCNYEETALNSFLLLEDMAYGYSEEFKDGAAFDEFVENFAAPFHIDVKRDDNGHIKFFSDLFPEEAALSPGQQYLLRIAVACYCNKYKENLIFLLDEPELHLHPQAQIELIKTLRRKFSQTQFWIATHSLALISYLTVAEMSTTVLYLRDGKTDILRSNSGPLLEGLIGSEENRFAISQLMAAPDEYACNKFAAECRRPPDVVSAKGGDPQTELVRPIFKKNDVVVDFGVGKGRFLEELAFLEEGNIVREICYYAYDRDNTNAEECKNVMSRYGVPEGHYYNSDSMLMEKVAGKADYVLLVNVLHEISPQYWEDVFGSIRDLLKDEGKLIIVEREELTVGEAPYSNGFLMMTKNGAVELFGINDCDYEQHDRKKYIVKYTIEKAKLMVAREKVLKCVDKIRQDAFQRIFEIKHDTNEKSDFEKYKDGIRLAFYLHQYANASLNLDEMNDKKGSSARTACGENNE